MNSLETMTIGGVNNSEESGSLSVDYPQTFHEERSHKDGNNAVVNDVKLREYIFGVNLLDLLGMTDLFLEWSNVWDNSCGGPGKRKVGLDSSVDCSSEGQSGEGINAKKANAVQLAQIIMCILFGDVDPSTSCPAWL